MTVREFAQFVIDNDIPDTTQIGVWFFDTDFTAANNITDNSKE